MNIFLNKKILIYGLGKSGLSTFKFLKDKSDIFLYDDNITLKIPEIKKNLIHYKDILKLKFDQIILSPGINIDKWNQVIKPTTDYHFHLWLPDIAMQFNYKNYPCLILPNLYTLNDQQLKTKYGIDQSSAPGARRGNEYHFGKYSNFDAWTERWGWYYEDIVNDFEQIKDNYKDTLIWDYYHHDISTGPLKSFNI